MPQLNSCFRFIFAMMIALLLSAPLPAQDSGAQQGQSQKNPDAPFPAAPIPAQILAARQVFISNALEETLDLAGGPSRTYDQFYAAVKSWHKYQLVSSPSAADLVFEISVTHITHATEVVVGDFPTSIQLRLVIVDPKTNTPLWTLQQPIEAAIRKATAERNFGNAITQLIDQLKQITAADTPVHQ